MKGFKWLSSYSYQSILDIALESYTDEYPNLSPSYSIASRRSSQHFTEYNNQFIIVNL